MGKSVLDEELVNFSLVCPWPKSKVESKRNSRMVRLIYDEIYSRNLEEIPSAVTKMGGDRSSKFHWTEYACQRLKQTTSDLLELWRYICDFFERNEYNRKCGNWLVDDDKFTSKLNHYPPPNSTLVEKVRDRKSKKGVEYKPLAFTLQHAWQIIGNGKPYSYSTLKKKYDKGAVLLKHQTKKPSIS